MVQKYGVEFLTLPLLIYVEIYGSVLSTVFDIDLTRQVQKILLGIPSVEFIARHTNTTFWPYTD